MLLKEKDRKKTISLDKFLSCLLNNSTNISIFFLCGLLICIFFFFKKNQTKEVIRKNKIESEHLIHFLPYFFILFYFLLIVFIFFLFHDKFFLSSFTL